MYPKKPHTHARTRESSWNNRFGSWLSILKGDLDPGRQVCVFRVVELGLVVYIDDDCARVVGSIYICIYSVEIVFTAHFFFGSPYSRGDNYFTRVSPDSVL